MDLRTTWDFINQSNSLHIPSGELRTLQTVTLATGVNNITKLVYVPELGQLWVGTATLKFVRFNNPNDLTDYTVGALSNIPAHTYTFDMIYIPTKNKIYVCNNGSPARVTEIDPVTMVSTDVISSNNVGAGWNSFEAITYTATHFFVQGYDNAGQTIVKKFLLSDFSLVSSVTLTGHDYGWPMRYDGTYIYLVTDVPDPTYTSVVKINPTDLSFTGANLPAGEGGTQSDMGITDTHLWVGTSAGSGNILKILKSDLSTQVIYSGIPSASLTSVEYDGTYIWAVAINQNSLVRINPNTNETFVYPISLNAPRNVESGGGKLFVGDVQSPASVSRFVFT